MGQTSTIYRLMQDILRDHAGCAIRRATHGDLIPVIEINLKTLPEHYSDYFYEELLRDCPEAFLVAESEGKVIGYILCKIEHGFSNFKRLGFVKKAHLVSIAILPEKRRGGLGSALVSEAIKGINLRSCHEFYLEVRCSNTDAVGMYQKLGFGVASRQKTYYRDGEDAYIMGIELEPDKK